MACKKDHSGPTMPNTSDSAGLLKELIQVNTNGDTLQTQLFYYDSSKRLIAVTSKWNLSLTPIIYNTYQYSYTYKGSSTLTAGYSLVFSEYYPPSQVIFDSVYNNLYYNTQNQLLLDSTVAWRNSSSGNIQAVYFTYSNGLVTMLGHYPNAPQNNIMYSNWVNSNFNSDSVHFQTIPATGDSLNSNFYADYSYSDATDPGYFNGKFQTYWLGTDIVRTKYISLEQHSIEYINSDAPIVVSGSSNLTYNNGGLLTASIDKLSNMTITELDLYY